MSNASRASEVRRDIYGNALDWEPTGRRRVVDSRLRGEVEQSGLRKWVWCRAHVDCAACAVPRDHDGCPRSDANP